MKKIICILLFCISCCCFAQTNKQSDSSKVVTMYDDCTCIDFEFDSIQPTNEGLQQLNTIGDAKELTDKFWFVFTIISSEKEEQNNIKLEFERMLFVLNYLKQNYNIKYGILFDYSGSTPNKFSMKFVLRHKCKQ